MICCKKTVADMQVKLVPVSIGMTPGHHAAGVLLCALDLAVVHGITVTEKTYCESDIVIRIVPFFRESKSLEASQRSTVRFELAW